MAEALDDCRPLAAERGVLLQSQNAEPSTASQLMVYSDRRVLLFILGQLLDNACKYADSPGGLVQLKLIQDLVAGRVCLQVWNNGPGVRPEDLPFIFDKGFSGQRPGQHATGFGLYLARSYARQLAIKLEISADSACGQGFGIQMVFPGLKVQPRSLPGGD
ncbi:hypothetical protein HCH52_08630 [Oscillospiraceae bacterium HV4-5-C5C]|nr:hypothetical protein [Oscillospiraceae bacterium HV4-5-C5C]